MQKTTKKRAASLFLAITMAFSLFIGAIPAVAADTTSSADYVVSNLTELQAALENAKASGTAKTIKLTDDITITADSIDPMKADVAANPERVHYKYIAVALSVQSDVTIVADSAKKIIVENCSLEIAENAVLTITENVTIYQPASQSTTASVGRISAVSLRKDCTFNILGGKVVSDANTTGIYLISGNQVIDYKNINVNIINGEVLLKSNTGRALYFDNMKPNDGIDVVIENSVVNAYGTGVSYSMYKVVATLRGNTQLTGTIAGTIGDPDKACSVYDFRNMSVAGTQEGNVVSLAAVGSEGPTYIDGLRNSLSGGPVFASVVNSDVYYTTDGSDPATSSTAVLYTAPFALPAGATLKAAPAVTFLANTYFGATQTINLSSVVNPELEITLASDKNVVRANEEFNVAVSFSEKVSSNVIKLDFAFDASKFEFVGYTAAAGATLLTKEDGAGFASVMVMVPDYNMENLGVLTLKAKAGVDIGSSVISATAEYVEKAANNDKASKEANGWYAQQTNSAGGDLEVDMLLLSDVIDAFGMTSDHPDWDTYKYFDFNGNGEIDIFDIVTLAKMLK